MTNNRTDSPSRQDDPIHIERARLVAIIESSDDAIVSKTLEGIITSWNQGAERIFGYTATEAIGKSIAMLIPPDRPNEEKDILDRIRQGDPVDHFETVRCRKDGSLIDISLTISPIRDDQGKVVGASKIARDITFRKASEALVHKAREEAEAANRAKDAFLAMLGHELRNPLSAIRNAIAAAELDEGSRTRALIIARRQADQLTRIVDDLLDVARFARGNVVIRKQRTLLSDIIERSLEAVRTQIEERDHSLTVTLPPEPIYLEADSARLQQAIINVLSNAAKYTDGGGVLSLSVERRGDAVLIRARDNGIGMEPDVLGRVFEPFMQADVSIDRAQGGLGLGLTLVRRVVELHGGEVEARSEGRGAGSEFIIRLPALAIGLVDANPLLPQAATGRSLGQAARVLMVEDNPDAAETLVMILELLGHHVRVVQDGPSAIAAARANVPDIMIIDIGLPGMDGYGVARAIRDDAKLKHLMLVALTGYGRPEDKTRAMAAGFDYHLAKPVDLDLLGELVGRLGARSAKKSTVPSPATPN